MQATVSRYDDATHSGAVLLDDGVEIPFEPDALAGSRLRLLRKGQRVTVAVDAEGSITSLQILTLPRPDTGEGRT